MHQDLLYFPFRPGNRIVGAWTALEMINEENGCLCLIPGSHKFGLFPHVPPDEIINVGFYGVQQEIIDNILSKPYLTNYVCPSKMLTRISVS